MATLELHEGWRITFEAGAIALWQLELVAFETTLKRCEWNVAKTAELCGISRSAAYAKIVKYRLHLPDKASRQEK